MKRLLAFTLICIGLQAWALPAFADLDEKDIQKILTKIEKGKGLDADGSYPDNDTKIFKFSVDGLGDGYYAIDMNAKLCFYIGKQNKTAEFMVPCQNLKLGYPLIAPLINWDE